MTARPARTRRRPSPSRSSWPASRRTTRVFLVPCVLTRACAIAYLALLLDPGRGVGERLYLAGDYWDARLPGGWPLDALSLEG